MTKAEFKKLGKFAKLATLLEQRESALKLFSQFSSNELSASEAILADIQSLESEVAALRNTYSEGLAVATALIDGIDDALIRVYMRLHYIRGLEWADVAMPCRESSGSAIQMKVRRYLSQSAPKKGGESL